MMEQKNLMHKAVIAESGASLSLQDAQDIISSDVRMPTNPNVAYEKLQGWSIYIDVFHGPTHPVAISVRRLVSTVGPNLYRVSQLAQDDTHGGMDYVWRIMYEAQQDYFSYVNARANNQAMTVPDFHTIISAVNTARVQKLCPLPQHWYNLVKTPETPTTTTSTGGPGSSRTRIAGAKRTNARANRGLMKRYAESGHSSISSMIHGHNVDYPSYRDKPVCLSWALKGECNDACKRKFNHVPYPADTNKLIHELMDKCGVASLES